jgi:hypothetical protein
MLGRKIGLERVNWKLEKNGRKISKIFSGVIPVFS